jgi:hypothetical protein
LEANFEGCQDDEEARLEWRCGATAKTLMILMMLPQSLRTRGDVVAAQAKYNALVPHVDSATVT